MIGFLAVARYRVSVTLLFILLGGNSSVNAAVYTGNWDPLFNSDFSSDLGWRGSITVKVDDSCLTPHSVQLVRPGCSAEVESGVLNFYHGVGTNPDFETRPFSGPFLPPIKKFSVDTEGRLDEIDLWLPIPGLATLFDESWLTFLDFSLSGASLTLAGPLEGHCHYHCPELEIVSSQSTPRVAFQLVSQVPEPGSLALVGLALASLGASRFRKQACAKQTLLP